MMGPMDLSLELGIPGELRHPRILAAYDASLKAAMGAGQHFVCGDAGGPPVAQLVAQGARILLGSNDANSLLHAMTQPAHTLAREAPVSGSCAPPARPRPRGIVGLCLKMRLLKTS